MGIWSGKNIVNGSNGVGMAGSGYCVWVPGVVSTEKLFTVHLCMSRMGWIWRVDMWCGKHIVDRTGCCPCMRCGKHTEWIAHGGVCVWCCKHIVWIGRGGYVGWTWCGEDRVGM